jgi:hypothetical protein
MGINLSRSNSSFLSIALRASNPPESLFPTYNMSTINQSNFQQSTVEAPLEYGIRLSTRPVTSVAGRQGPMSRLPPEQDPIKEIPWTLEHMLERYSFKASYPWSTTAASRTVLATIEIPEDLLVSTITVNPFEVFQFWRGDVELQIQVIGTPFHQGKIMAIFFPLLNAAQAAAQMSAMSFESWMVNPTLHLMPNTNSVGVMTIPYNNVQKYIDLSQANAPSTVNRLGTLVLVVMNRLELASTASDTVTVSVQSRLMNSEFKVPRVSQPITAFGFAQSSIVPKIKNTLVNVASGALSKLADTLLPDSIVGDALSFVGSFLDKPTNPIITDAVRVQPIGRMNFTTGVELIDKLTLQPDHTACSTEHTFGTYVDEMDFEYLKKKETYLGSFVIKTSFPVGTVVASFPINPVPSPITLNSPNFVPLLSFLSFPYAFWQGSLTYRFEVVATSMQTCKIFIAETFGAYAPITTLNVNQLTSQYGEAYEINQGSSSVTVTVPFVSTTDFKYVPSGNVYSDFDTTGYINVVILNPLVAPSNTPTDITVNVYIAGGDDFQLSTLTMMNNMTLAVANSNEAVAPLQLNDTTINLAQDELVSPPSSSSVRTPQTQAPVNHMQSVLKKYQPCGVLKRLATNANTSLYSFTLSNLFYSDSGVTYTGFPGEYNYMYGLIPYYSALFRQFRGPLRFKIVQDEMTSTLLNTSMTVFYQPPAENGTELAFASTLTSNFFVEEDQALPTTSATSGVAPLSGSLVRLPLSITSGSTCRVLEFEIPYTSRYSSVVMSHSSFTGVDGVSSDRSALGYLYLVVTTPPSEVKPIFTLHASFGDETRFGTLTNVPIVYPAVGSSSPTVFTPASPLDFYTTTPPTTNTLIHL